MKLWKVGTEQPVKDYLPSIPAQEQENIDWYYEVVGSQIEKKKLKPVVLHTAYKLQNFLLQTVGDLQTSLHRFKEQPVQLREEKLFKGN